MMCDCCGKRKRLLESFATIQTNGNRLNLCVDCNDLAYKIRDDANEMDKRSFDLHLDQWKKRAKKPSRDFIEWQKAFLSTLEDEFLFK